MKMMSNTNGLLMTVQDAARVLGIPKKAVLDMVSEGTLSGVGAGKKTFITKNSVLSLVANDTTTMEFGQQRTGYPQPEEVTCMLTNTTLGKSVEEEVIRMAYTGSVATLSDGRFMVQIDKGRKENGKRERESKSFKVKAEAHAYLQQRLAELNGTPMPVTPVMPMMPMMPMPQMVPQMMPQIMPMAPGVVYPHSSFTDQTFEEYALQQLVEGIGKATTRTIETYRRGLVPVIELIGHIPMVELTAKDIKKAFQKLSYHYADSNLKRSFTIVRLVIETAVENDDIPNNPMKKLKCPKSQKPNDKEKHAIYSDEDMQTLFETSKEYGMELYTMFALLECTGMRPAEMRALEWECFDPEAKTIRIKQAITKVYEELTTLKKAADEKEVVSVTKSGYGVRTLRLSDLAVKALIDWKREKSKSRNKVYGASPFIFSNREGEFKSESACQCMLKRYRQVYDLDKMGVNFYKFRHTMCTRLILDGQPIPVIQRIMGDNTVDVIMEIYTHVNEEMALKASHGFYENLNRKHFEMEA